MLKIKTQNIANSSSRVNYVGIIYRIVIGLVLLLVFQIWAVGQNKLNTLKNDSIVPLPQKNITMRCGLNKNSYIIIDSTENSICVKRIPVESAYFHAIRFIPECPVVKDYKYIVSRNPGVYVDENNEIYIRGSRPEATQLIIDGQKIMTNCTIKNTNY